MCASIKVAVRGVVNQQERSEKSVLDCASATDALARPSRCGIYSDILSALMTGMTRYPGVSYRHATTRSGVRHSAGVTHIAARDQYAVDLSYGRTSVVCSGVICCIRVKARPRTT